jgi:hypothetical protein
VSMPPDAKCVRNWGLDVGLRDVLCVDWVPHGPWDDQLSLIFDGGTLDAHHATPPTAS